MRHLILPSVILGVLLAGLIGCGKEARYESTFSPVYKELSAHIQSEDWVAPVEDYAEDSNWNPKTERGSQQMRGYFQVAGLENPLEDILAAVSSYFDSQSTSYHIEGDGPSLTPDEMESPHTLWMYNMGDRHGELHVWLFPCVGGDKVGFAIYHYELPFKDS